MDWIYSMQDPLIETVIGSIIMFFIVIVFTRIIGLRSFAKFTTFDFAFTVAIGSIIAAILTSSTSVIQGSVAILSLLSLTAIGSYLQREYQLVDNVISNRPLLLMDGEQMLEDNMKAARISRFQIISKLREANVLRFNQVRAVVLETTGDISVLHVGEDQDYEIEDGILEDVRRKP